ncbi:SSB domain-containing protein [Cephalotus follicularis]|uniref:SSB domain-containing protein n=1 Tax=Cephalotus follicularis TaxID=3775 RepID=A0A1Q3BZK8_CEPFO|nr:SSB domain-containing protein [Cephalotus follicularis]
MALNQILPTTWNLSLCVSKNPLTNPKTTYLSSPTPLSSIRLRSNNKTLRFNRSFKCLVDHEDHHQQIYGHQVSHPRPPEIPWRKEITNAVHLIGTVGTAVEFKHLPSGKLLAWTRLAVKRSATDTTWINLTFWDEMAQVASQHVEKGQQIYVSGRLVSDNVENEEGKQLTYYKVVVQQLNFVEKGASSISSYDRDSNFMRAGKKFANNAANSSGSTEELWQAFFANPVDWWDNRKNKRNPKYPDFKHKDTGEALWIEGRYNPPWVKAQLAILDTRMGYLHDQDSRTHANSFASVDFTPF